MATKPASAPNPVPEPQVAPLPAPPPPAQPQPPTPRKPSTVQAVSYTTPAGYFATSNANALLQAESKEYDPRFGGITKLVGPNGLATTWTYDTFARKTRETRADGTYTTWAYNLCTDAGAAAPHRSLAKPWSTNWLRPASPARRLSQSRLKSNSRRPRPRHPQPNPELCR